MIKVGITGGIGAGKSFVCRIFEEMGVPVYYADKEAKRLMWQDATLKHQIKQLFGDEAYHRNGRLNRTYLAGQIFGNKRLLKQMNAIVHPAVHRDLDKWFSEQNSKYAVEEAALIFESNNVDYFDKIITVAADDELRIARVMSRDGIDRKSILKRIKSQYPQSEKVKRSDYVIWNNGKEGLLKRIWEIHRDLSAL